MAVRKIRDERDARRCLAAAKAAGQPRREWARQHGVDGRSLYAWAKNLERGDKAAGTRETGHRERRGGLVELIPEASPTKSRYLIRCGQLAVEIDQYFDEATLARLLRVITEC